MKRDTQDAFPQENTQGDYRMGGLRGQTRRLKPSTANESTVSKEVGSNKSKRESRVKKAVVGLLQVERMSKEGSKQVDFKVQESNSKIPMCRYHGQQMQSRAQHVAPFIATFACKTVLSVSRQSLQPSPSCRGCPGWEGETWPPWPGPLLQTKALPSAREK